MRTAYEITESFLRQNPRTRAITFTLTRKNLPFRDLHNAVSEMCRAYDLLSGLRLWFALGTYRYVDVTLPRGDECHPHLHCLMVVNSSYFNRANQVYVQARDLGPLWQIALGADYEPVTNLKAVPQLYNVERWFGYLEDKRPPVTLADIEIAKFGGRLAELERRLNQPPKDGQHDVGIEAGEPNIQRRIPGDVVRGGLCERA